jgi:hypothetical protein
MTHTDAQAWLRQWREATVAVAQVEARELRELDEATALAMSEAVLSAAPREEMTAERRHTSGFVEQQRLFARQR